MSTEELYNDIMKNLEKSKSGLFATYDSLEEVNEYAKQILTSSARGQIEMSSLIVTGIYHNTLVELLKGMVTKAYEKQES